jgi:hypothetical protein
MVHEGCSSGWTELRFHALKDRLRCILGYNAFRATVCGWLQSRYQADAVMTPAIINILVAKGKEDWQLGM